jgi:hypothetical protein
MHRELAQDQCRERLSMHCLVAFDYMHYRWKNYLVRWQGQFQNKDGREIQNFGGNCELNIFGYSMHFLGIQLETMTL